MENIPTYTTAPAAAGTRIFTVRGKRVILDTDLAELYGVPTKRLNEQVRRNPLRFPQDFAFLLSVEEWDVLRSQFATLKTRQGQHRKYLPYVFTEHGALMAAGVLNSDRAIEVSIYVVRAFVAMREAVADTRQLATRLDELERRIERRFAGQDHVISEILAAIKALMNPPVPSQRPIGFVAPIEGKPKQGRSKG